MAYSKDQIETIFNDICKKISDEHLPIRKVLKLEGMPDPVTFYKWLDNDEAKIKQYARACDDRHDAIFEEILQIADTPQEGVTTKETEKGVEVTTGDMISHRRLQVDARKWMLSKMNPKKYGDKIDLSGKMENFNTNTELTEKEAGIIKKALMDRY